MYFHERGEHLSKLFKRKEVGVTKSDREVTHV